MKGKSYYRHMFGVTVELWWLYSPGTSCINSVPIRFREFGGHIGIGATDPPELERGLRVVVAASFSRRSHKPAA
jgi:hypothetical protein